MEYVLHRVAGRLRAYGLELHPEKTRIVYCWDINCPAAYPAMQFTFIGYTFRLRKVVDKYGRVYVNFAPAISREALRAMWQTIRSRHLQLMCDKQIDDLSRMFNPVPCSWGAATSDSSAPWMSAGSAWTRIWCVGFGANTGPVLVIKRWRGKHCVGRSTPIPGLLSMHSQRFMTRRHVKDKTLAWLLWYKRFRLHSTLNCVSPMQFESRWAADQAKQASS
ncbi:MAG TPA: hypothetical protein VN043_05645 [Rhodanobacter sp.]|nr:hypothetical protein [Rhodanobacter sp.]